MTIDASIQQLALDPVSVGLGIALGAAVTGGVLAMKLAKSRAEASALSARLESERAALGDHFRSLAQSALQSNNEQFLALAAERLRAAQKDGEHDLAKRSIAIEQMVKPVEAHLQRMNGMVEALKATDQTIRADLQNLHRETSKLTGVLRNPSAQGRWGEFVLETILEKADLIKGTHYETQVVIDGGRPDVVINLHDGFKIAVDSKAPINDYIARLEDDLSGDDVKAIKSNMARAVRGHVKALGARAYQDNVKGCDFVILFLPSEVVFSATLQSDPTIVDYAAENNVVIASPTLIISLLRVVGLSWRQVKLAESAAEISKLGAELHNRFTTFLDHFSKIGKGLGSAVQSYEKAVSSMNSRVLPAARKFQKLHAGNQTVTNVPSLEASARILQIEEDLTADDDLYEEEKRHG